MNVIRTPVAATCSTGSVTSCASGNANTAARAPHANETSALTMAAQDRAGRRGRRRERDRGADEAHHGLAAAPRVGERESVTGHRARRGGERGPVAADGMRDGHGHERLQAVADERRPGAAGAELLERVPRAGVAVAVRCRSTPWRLAVSDATGMEPHK